MTSTEQAKQMAKRLRASLTERNQDITHSTALELVSHQLGYRDWNTASAALSKESQTQNNPAFERPIPILRMFEEAKAREFYLDFLGFTIEFEHRFEAHLPLYLGIDRGGLKLHPSEHQAQEIAGASAAVNEMAVSIDQVSANASESTAVAERSVSIANKGNQVVHNTIVGMDNIREQIQDTSKRIKRLGESSQEIGDIVSLINDIADQTNILALNAAIQASMAGDAGRGFAVVADEVQRLAERSSGATKQIEALVKAIQTDTNEAVISMEQTTSEVVRGASLAQDAGVALEEIEKVSRALAGLIQNISNAARQQASSAGHISNTMNVIQEITSQTSAGTTATARSIGDLAKMANEMRRSVSGFKLPEDQSPS